MPKAGKQGDCGYYEVPTWENPSTRKGNERHFLPQFSKKKKGRWVIATQTQLLYWKCLAPKTINRAASGTDDKTLSWYHEE